jgi:hypothetical protein
VGSGWSVGECPGAQVPSVTGPWPWPWQRFASSAHSKARPTWSQRTAWPSARLPLCGTVCHGRLNSSAGAVTHCPRPSPATVSPATVTLESLLPTRCFYAPCFASSATDTLRPPALVAMLPFRHRRRRRCLSQPHITSAALDVSLSRPGPLTKHPGSDPNWAFVSAAGGGLIRPGMAQAGPSQPSARGKVLCSRADESWRCAAMIVRNARFGARPSLDGTGWAAAKREQNMPETASQRQPAPTCTSKASLALTAADTYGTSNTQHVVAVDLVPSRCLWPVSVQVGRHSSSCNLARPISITSQASSYTVAIIGRRCSTHCCQRLPKTCRAAHLRWGRQRQRDSTSPALSPQPKSSTLGLLHLHTFLDSVDSAHHITTPS